MFFLLMICAIPVVLVFASFFDACKSNRKHADYLRWKDEADDATLRRQMGYIAQLETEGNFDEARRVRSTDWF